MKNYFKDLYVKSLYGIANFGALIANKSLLTLINLNGLDPNADPVKLKLERDAKLLAAAFDDHDAVRTSNYYRTVKKVPYVGKSYKNVNIKPSPMPDFSNAESGGVENTKCSILTFEIKEALKMLEKYADLEGAGAPDEDKLKLITDFGKLMPDDQEDVPLQITDTLSCKSCEEECYCEPDLNVGEFNKMVDDVKDDKYFSAEGDLSGPYLGLKNQTVGNHLKNH